MMTIGIVLIGLVSAMIGLGYAMRSKRKLLKAAQQNCNISQNLATQAPPIQATNQDVAAMEKLCQLIKLNH